MKSKTKRRLAFLLGVITAASSFSGCGAAVPESPSQSSSDTIIALTGSPWQKNLDPSGHTTTCQLNAEWLVFDHLIKQDFETQEYEPELATAWEYKDDATLVVTIREGVKFQDGTDFDVNDVKASVEKYSAADSVTSCWWLEPMKVEIIDDKTVEITPESGNGYSGLINMLCMTPMMSSEDIESGEIENGYNGTGEYKFDRMEDGTLYLEAFEDCWSGAPKTKYFQYKYVADSSTRLAALQSGEADIIDRVDTEQLAIIESDPNVTYIETELIEQMHFIFKLGNEELKNVTLRQAIAYAIDRETIVTDIMMQDADTVADAHIAPAYWGYASQDVPTYNVEKAKELLAEAGYPNGEGLPEMDFVIPVGFYSKTKEYCEYIVSNLEAIGLKINLVTLEPAAWQDYLLGGGDTCYFTVCGWLPPGLEPDLKLNAWYRSVGTVTGGTDETLDALLDKEGQTLDADERATVLDEEVLSYLAENLPDLPLFNSVSITGLNANLEGFVYNPTGSFEIKDCVKKSS